VWEERITWKKGRKGLKEGDERHSEIENRAEKLPSNIG
jgi:hypothetical protein